MEAIHEGLFNILDRGEKPMTVRQVFYRAVVAHLIAKGDYDSVVRLLTKLRRANVIPYEWIADFTRWMRKPITWASAQQWLDYQAKTYRRAVWDEQQVRVEVWCESGSLAGVLMDVTDQWDVPLFPCNGQPSLTFLHSAGQSLASETRPSHIYYVGDHDGAGLDITRRVEAGLRNFAPHVDLTFERIAVTPAQIVEMNLPTRPPNKADMKRGWTECVEAEAIDPGVLRNLLSGKIVQHIDSGAYRRVMREEQAERETLEMLARNGLPMMRPRRGKNS